MDIFGAAEKRYSHKDLYLPNSVPLEHLEMIAKVGFAAPSGNNTQCVKFIILPDRASVQPLSELAPNCRPLQTAPAAIALLTTALGQKPRHNFEVEDYSASASVMLFAITALGYVSVWLDSLYFDEDRQKATLAILGAPESFNLRVVLPVGLPDGEGRRREKLTFEERVFYRKFGLPK